MHSDPLSRGTEVEDWRLRLSAGSENNMDLAGTDDFERGTISNLMGRRLKKCGWDLPYS